MMLASGFRVQDSECAALKDHGRRWYIGLLLRSFKSVTIMDIYIYTSRSTDRQ